jgi:hypothetical protein
MLEVIDDTQFGTNYVYYAEASKGYDGNHRKLRVCLGHYEYGDTVYVTGPTMANLHRFESWLQRRREFEANSGSSCQGRDLPI